MEADRSDEQQQQRAYGYDTDLQNAQQQGAYEDAYGSGQQQKQPSAYGEQQTGADGDAYYGEGGQQKQPSAYGDLQSRGQQPGADGDAYYGEGGRQQQKQPSSYDGFQGQQQQSAYGEGDQQQSSYDDFQGGQQQRAYGDGDQQQQSSYGEGGQQSSYGEGGQQQRAYGDQQQQSAYGDGDRQQQSSFGEGGQEQPSPYTGFQSKDDYMKAGYGGDDFQSTAPVKEQQPDYYSPSAPDGAADTNAQGPGPDQPSPTSQGGVKEKLKEKLGACLGHSPKAQE